MHARTAATRLATGLALSVALGSGLVLVACGPKSTLFDPATEGDGDGEGVMIPPPTENVTPDPDPDPDAGTPAVTPAMHARVTADSLNLRDAPGTAASILTAMPCGALLEVLDGPSAD